MTDFDRLIDGAARDMTASPAPPHLRERVEAEIRHAPDRRVPWSWLAAAAAVVLLVYLSWAALRERPNVDGALPAQAQKTIPAERPALDDDRRVERGDAKRPAQPRLPTRQRPPAADLVLASLPALDAPAAIEIVPLDAGTDDLPALDAVGPLEIEQLDIKPLTSPPPATGGH